MKAKAFSVAVIFAFSAMSAHANCVGSGSFYTCTDAEGNNYSVSKYGNTTQVYGSNSNTGNTWNQTSNQVGNSTYTYGTAANGNSWNTTETRSGNTTYSSGVGSNGNAWNGTSTTYGGTTTYSGTDSHGNFVTKSCNAYGCF